MSSDEGSAEPPWIRSSGSDGVGICLSGGGIRAASFSLGVLQALQAERGLLFGEGSANYLAAVSGGSYAAAAQTLEAARQASEGIEALPPLAPGSPEIGHILTHGEYLAPRHWLAVLVTIILNVLAFAMLFVWVGLMLADVGAIVNGFIAGSLIPHDELPSTLVSAVRAAVDMVGLHPVLSALAVGLGILAIVRGFYVSDHRGRLVWPVLGLPLLILGSAALLPELLPYTPTWATFLVVWPAALVLLGALVLVVLVYTVLNETRVDRRLPIKAWLAIGFGVLLLAWPALAFIHTAWPESWEGVRVPWIVLGPALAVPGSVIATAAAGMLGIRQLVGPIFVVVGVLASRLFGLALLLWCMTAWYGHLDAGLVRNQAFDPGIGAAIFFTLVIAVPFGYIPKLVALHGQYRKRIGSCFAVVRRNGGVAAVPDTPLSSLQPVDGLFPRLILCATANVKAIVGGAQVRFAPFVFSHDRSGVPGSREAWFDTRQLEFLQQPGLRYGRRTFVVRLMDAVATAGAAISPVMGRHTIPSLTMAFVILNVRSGAWLPNPFRAAVQRRISELRQPERLDNDAKMLPGYNELIPELFGVSGQWVYVSDGGHYDNLGLITLLHARCKVIWCVDSSDDPSGIADELDRVLKEATGPLLREYRVDARAFRAVDGRYPVTHTIGRLTYADGAEADLVVIKLGLSSATDEDVLAYKGEDIAFPHHSTAVLAFDERRMDMYRRLGVDSTRRACADRDAPRAG